MKVYSVAELYWEDLKENPELLAEQLLSAPDLFTTLEAAQAEAQGLYALFCEGSGKPESTIVWDEDPPTLLREGGLSFATDEWSVTIHEITLGE